MFMRIPDNYLLILNLFCSSNRCSLRVLFFIKKLLCG